jgi:hypothetical protein
LNEQEMLKDFAVQAIGDSGAASRYLTCWLFLLILNFGGG